MNLKCQFRSVSHGYYSVGLAWILESDSPMPVWAARDREEGWKSAMIN